MTKREIVYRKFNGLCAYTGKPLGKDWQIDHMTSKLKHSFYVYDASNVEEIRKRRKEVDNIENLLPALRIVNHYKRSLDLEAFRHYMLYFHNRLKKLPKNTNVDKTKKRIEYMTKVADCFGITTDKPFEGKFYFEKI
jgi:hypothetical protein